MWGQRWSCSLIMCHSLYMSSGSGSSSLTFFFSPVTSSPLTFRSLILRLFYCSLKEYVIPLRPGTKKNKNLKQMTTSWFLVSCFINLCFICSSCLVCFFFSFFLVSMYEVIQKSDKTLNAFLRQSTWIWGYISRVSGSQKKWTQCS